MCKIPKCNRGRNDVLFCHQERKPSLYVGEIASGVNALLRERGEMLELTPRQVGSNREDERAILSPCADEEIATAVTGRARCI